MPALSAAERAAFDVTAYPAIGYVYMAQPDVIFEAPLQGAFYNNGAIVALDYGTPTIGAFGDIEPEQTLELWDSDSNAYGRQRIRKAATASAIFVGRSPNGSRSGELQPESGATIKVYDERRVWGKIPYIDPASGTQYKDELPWPGDNAAQPPVANAGPDRLVLTAGSSAEIDLDALGSVPSFAVRSGATLSSYLWDIADGTLTSGTLTSSAISVDFPRGERYVTLTVTDSNGISHTGYVFVVVAQPDDCLPVQRGQERIRRDGVTWQFQIDPANLPAGVRPGGKVLYSQHQDYALGEVALRFSGWLGTEIAKLERARDLRRAITITGHDIAGRLRQLYGFEQTVALGSAGGTGWYKMPDASIDRLTHYYWQWHTNALSLADFKWSAQGGTYPLPRFTTDGATLWAQGARLARAIGYELTCNTQGQLRVLGDPIALPTAAQASEFGLPTQRTAVEITTLTETDYGEYALPGETPPRHYWHFAEAVVASSSVSGISAVRCAAPSRTPGQGSQLIPQDSEQLVVGQDELNVRTGNRYASRTNPRMGKATLTMVKTRHYIEPANLEWLRVIWPAAERARYGHLSAAGERYLVEEIINRYDAQSAQKESEFILEREFVGVPAETVPIPVSAEAQYADWDDFYVPLDIAPLGDLWGGLVPGAQRILAVLSDGSIAVTTDFDTPSWEGGPTWVVYDHSATLGSSVVAYSFQAAATNVSAWLVTPTAIWHAANLQAASPTFTNQHTFASSSSDRNIDSDYINAPGLFALVATRYASDDIKAIATKDGSTWGSESTVGSGAIVAVPPGCMVSTQIAGRAWIGMHNAVTDGNLAHYRRTDDYGASFTKLSNLYDEDVWGAGFLAAYAASEGIAYSSYTVLTATGDGDPSFSQGNYLFRLNLPDVGMDDISPYVSGTPYGPDWQRGRFTIAAADDDASKVAFVGINEARTATGVWITTSGQAASPSWTELVSPSGSVDYRRCALVNKGQELYVFGLNGAIGYTASPYSPGTIDDRIGNLATSAEVIGIAGFG